LLSLHSFALQAGDSSQLAGEHAQRCEARVVESAQFASEGRADSSLPAHEATSSAKAQGLRDEQHVASESNISYTEFWRQQRQGASAAVLALASETATSADPGAVHKKSKRLASTKSASERSGRIERIQELRRARGVEPMPELDFEPSVAPSPGAQRSLEAPLTDHEAGHGWDPTLEETLPNKRVVCIRMDSTATKCTCEPESEAWEAQQERPAGGASIASQSSLVALQPHHVGLVATKDMVNDLKLRWQRYCSEGRPRPREEMAPSPTTDTLFEELQAKWREVRGEMRPELQALVAPLEFQRLDFSGSRR